jgi:hypothetical protein
MVFVPDAEWVERVHEIDAEPLGRFARQLRQSSKSPRRRIMRA